MDEFRRLATEYYNNTVSIKFFGIKGSTYIIMSIPFLIFSVYLSFFLKSNLITMLPMLAGGLLWSKAKKQYSKNLIRHLQFYTHSTNGTFHEQKAIYLQSITSHIAPSLFETMKVFREVIETDNHNRSFVLNNGWHHFFKFLYNAESKNRILSLLIYLISLIAILTVVKPELHYDIYELINLFSFEGFIEYLLLITTFILLGYALIVIPLMFFITYIIAPFMLKISSNTFLDRFFISELNKHSFLECR